jgi:hypothetical protein
MNTPDPTFDKELKNVQKDLHNFKNPQIIEINTNMNEDDRLAFYNNISKYTPNDIIAHFDKITGMNLNHYNFSEVNDKKLQKHIDLLTKIEINIKHKFECRKNNRENK